MKLLNEDQQINELIRRLNYYEKGLRAGKKIEHETCNLCSYSAKNCSSCIIYSGRLCSDGSRARASVSDECDYIFNSKVIREWQEELKWRANKRLKDSGSKWRIAWERVK